MKLWKIIPPIWNLLNLITPFEWVRVITDRDDKDDYLVRYYLLSSRFPFELLGKHVHPWFNQFSYRVTLHNTKKSDDDGLHDHPWSWGSRILQGGYYEDEPTGRTWRGPEGGWRWKSAKALHRLVLPEPKDRKEDTWSLFVMGPKEKSWGFLDETGKWVHYREYLDNRVSGAMG